MSDASGGPTAAEIVSIVHDRYVSDSLVLLVILLTKHPAFLLYDYLISLDREIELFWTRSLTGASAIYFFTRYTTLICYDVLGAITFAHLSDTSCALLTKAQAAFSMIQYIPWAVFAALRVLALSGMNWPLAILVFLLGIAPVATNFAQYGFNLTGVNDPITGCQAQLSITRVQVEMTCLILADTIAVVVTVVQTRKAVGVSSSGRSLGHVLLYDVGAVITTDAISSALLCFSILDLALSVIALITPHHSGTYVTALTDPLTAILVSRFLLDLQAANTLSVGSNSRDALDGEEGTLIFAGVIGSLGASLPAAGQPEIASVDDTGGDESKLPGHQASQSMEMVEVPKQIESGP
ncbi:hypothetical protein C2E23DRAFT_828545 [Lenzites betulinus]|nr:hypothetical protein C2E23DRAFT_828545 [Lenzites betulinus]